MMSSQNFDLFAVLRWICCSRPSEISSFPGVCCHIDEELLLCLLNRVNCSLSRCQIWCVKSLLTSQRCWRRRRMILMVHKTMMFDEQRWIEKWHFSSVNHADVDAKKARHHRLIVCNFLLHFNSYLMHQTFYIILENLCW